MYNNIAKGIVKIPKKDQEYINYMVANQDFCDPISLIEDIAYCQWCESELQKLEL